MASAIAVLALVTLTTAMIRRRRATPNRSEPPPDRPHRDAADGAAALTSNIGAPSADDASDPHVAARATVDVGTSPSSTRVDERP